MLHGAESDIIWLQQDFNLYIVNMFDTYHASKLLGTVSFTHHIYLLLLTVLNLDFPRHGLAHLLEMYCDFTPDKRFQLADWRIRCAIISLTALDNFLCFVASPLPEEMLQYARSDTHFLLFIYDNLRNALIDRAQSRAQSLSPSGDSTSLPANTSLTLLREALARSEETALHLYVKEPYDAEEGKGSGGWDNLARKWNKLMLFASATLSGTPAMQREVFKCVHAWRDKVARDEDESTRYAACCFISCVTFLISPSRYVLANHHLFHLAEQPPGDMAALLRVFSSVPPVIKRRAKELLEVIRDCVRMHLQKSMPPTSVEIAPVEPTADVAPQVQKAETIAPDPTSTELNLWSKGAISFQR